MDYGGSLFPLPILANALKHYPVNPMFHIFNQPFDSRQVV
jgi:hypothetical protein